MIVGLNKILLNIIHLLLSVPVALMWRYMVAKLRGQVLAEPAVSPVKGSAGVPPPFAEKKTLQQYLPLRYSCKVVCGL